MASNKAIRFGPLALTSTLTTNLINCALGSLSGPVGFTMTQPYLLLKHIRIVNTTGSAITVSLFIGATGANAAGTEFLGSALSIAANSAYDWYGTGLRLDSTNFLTGGASASGCTLEAEGEIGIS